jgi:hypothetical protein
MSSVRFRAAVTGIALIALVGCSSLERDRRSVADALATGEDAATEALLREVLERRPEDIELLLTASDFYVRADAPDYYRPRLSLHYAMRADRAAGFTDARATLAMVRGHRAAGGFEESDALVREGLAGVDHPDAQAPVRLEPVDPDLVEVTLPNLIEQRRRQTDGRPTPVCEEGLLLVPVGEYPSATIEEPYCVEERDRPAPIPCDQLELRACTEPERSVAAGAVAGLLKGEPDGHRCCGDPSIVRVKPGEPTPSP